MASQSRNAGWSGELKGTEHSRRSAPATFGKSSAQKILDTFADLQRFISWHRAMQGFCLLIIWWSLVTLVGGTFDYWLRPADWPSRSLWLILFLGVGSYGIRTLWRSSSLETFNAIGLGLQLERKQPQLVDRLASGLEFSSRAFHQDAGSIALQKYAVDLAASKLPRKPAELVVNSGHTLRLAVMAVTFLAVLAGFVMMRPVLARTALARLYTPWLAVNWPENVHLQILSAKDGLPASLSYKLMDPVPFSHLTRAEQIDSAPSSEEIPLDHRLGSTLDVLVYNRRGKLPDHLQLETTTSEPVDAHSIQNVTPMTPAGVALNIPDPRPLEKFLPKQISPVEVKNGVLNRFTEMALFQLPVTQNRMWFRVAGGDHATAWRLIRGIEPVRLERFQIRLEPPTYLRQPQVTLPENVGSFEAPVGSRVFFEGTTSRQTTSARLRFGDGKTLKLRLLPKTQEVQGVFALTQPGTGSWTIELSDATGIQEIDPARFSFRVIADQAPIVTLEAPETDLTVTLQAMIPLKARARDDHSLALTGFAYRWSGSAQWETLASWPVSFDNQGTEPTTAERQSQFETTLDLASLTVPESSPREMKISVMAFARDRFHLGTAPEDAAGDEVGHEGRSTIRWITILTASEKQNELAERVLSQIEALRRVRERLEKGRETAIEWAKAQQRFQAEKSNDPPDATLQELGRQLTQANEQARQQVEANIIPEFERIRREGIDNQVIDETQAREWQAVQEELRELTTGPLTDLAELSSKASRPISQKETTPAKDNSDPSQTDPSQTLAEALRQNHEAAIETTSALISRLSQWEGKRGLQRELDELQKQQAALQKESAELATETIARGEMELSSQQKSQLLTLKDRQRALAGRVEQWRKTLGQLQAGTRSANAEMDLEDRRSLKSSQQIFDQAALQELALDAAEHLAENQLGKAAEKQTQLLNGMEKLRQEFLNRPPAADELLLGKIENLERDVQEELFKILSQPDQNSTDEEQLQKRTRDEELSARASKLSLRRAAATLEQAAEVISPRNGKNSDTSGKDEEPDELSPEELTLRRQREQQRRELMEQATREIAQERRLLQEKLLAEKISKVVDQLQSLLERVQAQDAEIQRLAQIGGTAGQFSRSQLKTIIGVAEATASIRDELGAIAENVAPAEILSWSIRQTSELAGHIARDLRERRVEPMARERSQQLIKRLLAIVQVLRESSSSQAQSGAGGGRSTENGPVNQEGSGPPAEAISKLVQLRLIRDLQQDLMARTKEFEAGDAQETTDVQREQLAQEQAELRELLSNLLDQLSSQASSGPGEKPLSEQPAPNPPLKDSTDRPIDRSFNRPADEVGQP
ncbi:hypothetical protein [Planctopirus hydrillae]|uniref:Uncharacterized protein n=1 Tax=Planctopirus hydrillae TaxID=1841610 RepID=A0A1C3EDM5_9PLAN|nr:hypothetical protein [Planctopirus hydrillae]ODA31335.1 hypothetical protein A6X21_05205 [Planctopirus hydrillae]